MNECTNPSKILGSSALIYSNSSSSPALSYSIDINASMPHQADVAFLTESCSRISFNKILSSFPILLQKKNKASAFEDSNSRKSRIHITISTYFFRSGCPLVAFPRNLFSKRFNCHSRMQKLKFENPFAPANNGFTVQKLTAHAIHHGKLLKHCAIYSQWL